MWRHWLHHNHFRMAKSGFSACSTTMVYSCCAFNCTTRDSKENREAGITFYRIPLTEPKRTLWLNAIKRVNFEPKQHSVICSKHFVGGMSTSSSFRMHIFLCSYRSKEWWSTITCLCTQHFLLYFKSAKEKGQWWPSQVWIHEEEGGAPLCSY